MELCENIHSKMIHFVATSEVIQFVNAGFTLERYEFPTSKNT